MANHPSIFLSYNPGNQAEETLALRLHTLGIVNGLTMHLPERGYLGQLITEETKSRIAASNYYILFSTSPQLGKVALEEIGYAFSRFQDKSRIIIIYDRARGKNMMGTDQCTELYFDRNTETQEAFIQKVIQSIRNKEKKNTDNEALAGFVLAGLGLLFLGAVLSGKK